MPLRRPDVDGKNNIKVDLKMGGRALTDLMWFRSGYGVEIMWRRQRTILLVKGGGFLVHSSRCWCLKMSSAFVRLQIRCYWTAEETHWKNTARFEALTTVLPTTRVFWDVPPNVRANTSPLILAHRSNVIPLKMHICASTVFNTRLPAVNFEMSCLSCACVFERKKSHNRFKSLSFPPIHYNISVSRSVCTSL